ncbi:hypothetical protein ABTD21_19385, partial [Acinetobacter baumannii]
MLVGLLDAPRERPVSSEDVDLDRQEATTRAGEYLRDTAPIALEGAGGDATSFRVAAHLKDLGVSEAVALDLMLEHWNERCSPPWTPEELAVKVENAYRYGQNPAGVLSPQSEFR